ncbi:TM2 domain-containing protein [Iamia majanohamensis]|uniref:TM2 domain-containing protein n=1 Tax=Iamia majanohamensis TaxID=467976 RepID=A0AAE9Y387_9ACTN|nr:TM2 domain-containing protein [Iamia majanohamensis]WCO65585.1 TM2 domain-containing protein [Iamia majanohamensis]
MSNVPPPSDPSNQPPPTAGAPSAPPPPPAGTSAGGAVPSASSTGSTGGILSATWMMNDASPPAGWAPKQKMVAGILGILLGAWGIHSFYMGNSKKGIIQIVATIVTCGILGFWGLIEGILILIGNDQAKTDAYGVPLAE